jgi:hypothetical protein
MKINVNGEPRQRADKATRVIKHISDLAFQTASAQNQTEKAAREMTGAKGTLQRIVAANSARLVELLNGDDVIARGDARAAFSSAEQHATICEAEMEFAIDHQMAVRMTIEASEQNSAQAASLHSAA